MNKLKMQIIKLSIIAFVGLSLGNSLLAQQQDCSASSPESAACIQKCVSIVNNCIDATKGEDKKTAATMYARCQAAGSNCKNGCSNQAQRKEEGWVTPKYYVLSVVYAPPGSAGGTTGSVNYASSDATGTSMSVSDSFETGASIAASVDYGVVVGAGYATSSSTENTSTIEARMQSSEGLSVPGQNADGIDHSRDKIYLWLNPRINVKVCGNRIEWSPAVDPSRPSHLPEPGMTTFVYASELKDPTTMHPSRRQPLISADITEADYPAILAHDPLAAPSSIGRYFPLISTNDPSAHPHRYAYLTNFDYQPPDKPDDKLDTQHYGVSNKDATSSTTTYTDSTSVACVIGGGISLGLFSAAVTAEKQWTWTNSTTYATSASHEQSATVDLTQPSYAWRGQTKVLVWWDTLYSTFAFSFPTAGPSLSGVLTKAGSPQAFKPVVVNISGRNYHAWTNAKGEYTFFYLPYGKAKVQYGSVSQKVTISNKPSQKNINVR